MAIAAREEKRLTAILLMLLTFLLFTGIDTSAKWLVQAGLPAPEVVFVRFAVHLIIAMALILPQEGRRLFRTSAPGQELLRGLFLVGSTFFNFFALKYLPLTVTVAIFFATPLVFCALSIPLLGERVGLRRWSAIGVGFLGVLVVTRPWSASFHWAMGLSFGALFCTSMYFVMTRKLAGVDSARTQQFLTSLIAVTVAAATTHCGIPIVPEAPPDRADSGGRSARFLHEDGSSKTHLRSYAARWLRMPPASPRSGRAELSRGAVSNRRR